MDTNPDTAPRTPPIPFPTTEPQLYLVCTADDEQPVPGIPVQLPAAIRYALLPDTHSPLLEVLDQTGTWCRLASWDNPAPGYPPDAPEANDLPYPHLLYRLQSAAVIEQD